MGKFSHCDNCHWVVMDILGLESFQLFAESTSPKRAVSEAMLPKGTKKKTTFHEYFLKTPLLDKKIQ